MAGFVGCIEGIRTHFVRRQNAQSAVSTICIVQTRRTAHETHWMGCLPRRRRRSFIIHFTWYTLEFSEYFLCIRSRYTKRSQKRCEAFLAGDTTSLSSDIKVPVFQLYLRNGGDKEYDTIKKYYYNAPDNAERKHVLNSLGCIPSPDLKKKTMEWTSFSNDVKLQDFFYAMGSVSRSDPVGRNVAWTYFKENHLRLKQKLENGSPHLSDAIIVMCAGSFVSTERVTEVSDFFKENAYPKNTRKISQMIESMKTNAQLYIKLQNHTDELKMLLTA